MQFMLKWAKKSLPVCVCVCVLPSSKLPQTQMEWAQLLESQQRYHDAELHKWREIIKSSVLLLDQVTRDRPLHGGLIED